MAIDRDVAIRLDGMLMGVCGNLNGIAHYMKNNLSEDEFAAHVRSIGASMAAVIDISSALHAKFPDLLPKELQPDDY